MNTYFRTGVVTLLLGFSLTACHEAKKSDTSAESTPNERKLDFQSDDEFLTAVRRKPVRCRVPKPNRCPAGCSGTGFPAAGRS